MPAHLDDIGPALVPAAAGLVTAGLIVMLRPFLVRYALARPNARSLHTAPTPQGGGIAVMLATLAASCAAGPFLGLGEADWRTLARLSGAAAGLTLVGGIDDVRPLPAAPRLVLQIALAALAISALPGNVRLVEAVPIEVERSILVVALAGFVNLANFMDGMDWMTVAEIVPVSAALAAFAALGVLPPSTGLIALALAGAMVGFAPFNAPVARLFLGDVGSLPIGLLIGYGLIDLALRRESAAAVLLPLYYLADGGSTLLRRALRGAPLWKAHREHFYQLAVVRGLTTAECIAGVFGLNVMLAALAFASHAAGSATVSALFVVAGLALTALLLRRFARGKSSGRSC
ncbi:MAG: glycosyl transferase [Methylobacteriaceae bacterium]|nr:glycosyl transferase [Methylobacteriaceae bacterium]